MARPTLTIDTEINEACTTMTMWDTTADYGGGTVTTAGIESSTIVVRNKTTGTYFTYTFTIGTNVISAATLSLDGGTGTDILAELSSTAFPFILNVNEFDLWADYGVTLPDFDDAVYQIEYTITRTTATAYSYTTSKMNVRDCDLCECIAGKLIDIDPSCDCSDKNIPFVQRIQALNQSAIFAAEKGMTTKAVNALNKAIELCNCSSCNDC